MVWYVGVVALSPLFGDIWTGGKDEPGKYHATKFGFINGIDQFDPLEFGISVKEAANFDPAIRLTLEAAQAVCHPFLLFSSATYLISQALQDSGIDYRGSNTGVFFGNLLTTIDELDDERYEMNNYNGVGRCVSIRANRISFTFDLRGPSLTVDTGLSLHFRSKHVPVHVTDSVKQPARHQRLRCISPFARLNLEKSTRHWLWVSNVSAYLHRERGVNTI